MQHRPTLSAIKEAPHPFKRVLVVEDDLTFGSILIQTIREETPYEAILATTGMEALDIVIHLKCDLFLLDYLMPGMNGLELYDRLHAVAGYEKTPAFFLSASTQLPLQDLEQRNLKSFTKLTELDDLLYIIQEFMNVPME